VLLELPGERRLLQLAADRARTRHTRVLDELLRDRRSTLDYAFVGHVGPHRPRDPADVDAVVLVEPLVLDGHDRLLHDRRDLVGVDQDAALRAAQRCQDRVVVVRIDVPVDLVRDLPGVAVRDLAGDRGDQPEAERGEAEHEKDENEREKAELADPAATQAQDFSYGARARTQLCIQPAANRRLSSSSVANVASGYARSLRPCQARFSRGRPRTCPHPRP
jgi:hypothetical protein